MKDFLLKQLKSTLRFLAKRTLRKYQPGIIAVTGSVGKTSTRTAIYAVLKDIRSVRMAGGNFNNEIGLPLTILGDWDKIGGFLFWSKVIAVSVFRLIFRTRYPEILILEYGVDRPGDMKYLLDIARPQIGVVTAIGSVPVHVEFFSGPDALLREKSRVVENLPQTGFAILNKDDADVFEMKDRTRGHILTYGFSEGSEVRITNFENRYVGMKPIGVYFKINYGGSFVPVRIDGIVSRAQALSSAAAAATGLVFGLNLVRIAENLQGFKSADGRMNIVPGIKGSYVLDDSYNAAPLSMWNALDTVKGLKAKRRIAILGDMLEIGKYTAEVHESIGKEAAKIFDLLFTVGPRGKFIAEAAAKNGLSSKKIFSFDEVSQALEPAADMIKKGDLILIKASHAVNLSKMAERISNVG